MANVSIDHCRLAGRPRFGPFVIFISTQILTIKISAAYYYITYTHYF
jgi:hypothetical protein